MGGHRDRQHAGWLLGALLDNRHGRLSHAPRGQRVTVDYEPAMQDGYRWRAVRVRVDGAQEQDADAAGHAYRSTLDIEWDSNDA